MKHKMIKIDIFAEDLKQPAYLKETRTAAL